jgi:hypothetical protein
MTRVWTGHAEIVADLRKRWNSGQILAEVAGAPSIFPYRIRMTRPTTEELSSRFDEVREWVQGVNAIPGLNILPRTVGTRTIRRNEIPGEVSVPDIDVAVSLLGEQSALETLRARVVETQERMPALVQWIAAHPLQAVELTTRWSRLVSVVAWLKANPQPGIYVRQIDIPGVDTKFIERHADVLVSLVDMFTDDLESSSRDFAERFGFRAVPQTIRIRSLDPTVVLAPGLGDRPITLTIEDASSLAGIGRVFITENYVNFLSFPSAAESVVIFGEGFDVGKIASLPWILYVPVHYWGDIDTWGFTILDQLRARLPHAESMLMDHATLYAHELQWGVEPTQSRRDLPHLNTAERALYDDLRDNRIRPNLRFEQELTSFALVEQSVHHLPVRPTT